MDAKDACSHIAYTGMWGGGAGGEGGASARVCIRGKRGEYIVSVRRGGGGGVGGRERVFSVGANDSQEFFVARCSYRQNFCT